MIASYKAVFFDAGGTLFHPYPSVGEIYARVGARHGCRASADELERRFRAVWMHRDGLSGHSSEKVERDWWRHLVHEVFSGFEGIADFEAFFAELYDVFADPASWRLYGDAAEILESLKERGQRLGIVSNWDSRLFRLCEGLGVAGHFDFILASAVFGASKPNIRIFQEALRRAGVASREAVHIGDSLEDDIRGAHAAGIHAILIDRSRSGRTDHRAMAREVQLVGDLRELLS